MTFKLPWFSASALDSSSLAWQPAPFAGGGCKVSSHFFTSLWCTNSSGVLFLWEKCDFQSRATIRSHNKQHQQTQNECDPFCRWAFGLQSAAQPVRHFVCLHVFLCNRRVRRERSQLCVFPRCGAKPLIHPARFGNLDNSLVAAAKYLANFPHFSCASIRQVCGLSEKSVFQSSATIWACDK